jgi:hypothetical protein
VDTKIAAERIGSSFLAVAAYCTRRDTKPPGHHQLVTSALRTDRAVAVSKVTNVFNGDGVMRIRTCDWIASVVLFVFAILIILAFGFV